MTIKEYCDEMGITLTKFSKVTDLSLSYVYTIQNGDRNKLSLDSAISIYELTTAAFGKGYLDDRLKEFFKRVNVSLHSA